MRHTSTKKILLGSTALAAAGHHHVRAETDNPTAAEIKAVLEQVNNTFEQFKKANDERLKGVENKFDDVLNREKVAKIDGDLAELQKAFNDINARLARAQLGAGGGDEITEEAKAHKQAFNSWFRRGDGEQALKEAQIKAAATSGNDPDGGYLVPAEVEQTIDRVLGKTSVMRQLASVRSIGAPVYKKPVNLGGAASGWVGETEGRPGTDTPKLSLLEFPTMELYAQPFATQTLLDDASVDIAAWLADEVNIEFAEQEGGAFLGGDGVKQPRGLLRYDVVDNATWAWGKVGYVGTGASSAWPGSNPADKLLDLIYALKAGYRNNASFLMNSLLVSDIRKFKDQEGNYLWQPSLQAGQPSTLLGYPVHDDDNMPVKAASSLSVAFGDFKRAYLIVDRVGIRVLRDPFTNKPYVGFYTTKRVGGGIQNFEAVKLLRFA